MSVSTKAILNKLLQSPMTRGQLQSSFVNTSDSKSGHSSDRYLNTSVIEDGRSDDALQLKIKPPKLVPTPKHKLTSAEEKQLDREFVLAQHMLHKFKEMLRQEGLDVSNYSVSKHNGRVSFNVPQEHSSRFQLFMTNKITPAKQVDTRESEPPSRRGMRM